MGIIAWVGRVLLPMHPSLKTRSLPDRYSYLEMDVGQRHESPQDRTLCLSCREGSWTKGEIVAAKFYSDPRSAVA